jgi:hypothetical protein
VRLRVFNRPLMAAVDETKLRFLPDEVGQLLARRIAGEHAQRRIDA